MLSRGSHSGGPKWRLYFSHWRYKDVKGYGWLTGTWKEMFFPPSSEEIIREKADDIPHVYLPNEIYFSCIYHLAQSFLSSYSSSHFHPPVKKTSVSFNAPIDRLIDYARAGLL